MPKIEIPNPVFLDRLGGDEVYGYGQDGDVTITADTTLSRDMYYNNLTINSSCTLDTNGYRVFVKGTLTFTDSTSRIGRFTNKTATGTLKGGFDKGTAATDTLGGRATDDFEFIVTHDGTDFEIDGTANATISMEQGFTYTFNQYSDTNQTDVALPATPVAHTIKFSETSDGTHNSGTEYTTGVTATGTVGSDGKTEIDVDGSTPSTLYYYCENHSGEGGQINVTAEDTSNQFFSGENELFNLSVAIAGTKFDQASGSYKSLSGGAGGSDSTEIEAAGSGDDGADTNYANYQTVGAAGGKGATGNSATLGTGAQGGGVVIVVAKTISGDGTIRADGDDAVSATQGTLGAPAPDASTPGNNYSYPGNNYSYGYSYPGNNYSYGYSYPGNNYSYGGNSYSYPGTPGGSHQHYHWHPVVVNNYSTGTYHYHYNHYHPGNPTNYGTNPTNYGTNPTNYGANNGTNPTNYGNNNASNPTNYAANPTTTHRGGRGGRGQKVTDGYNAGGGTVILVSGTKPLPSGLTTAASAGTGGSAYASAGTVVTVYNIPATDTDPGA